MDTGSANKEDLWAQAIRDADTISDMPSMFQDLDEEFDIDLEAPAYDVVTEKILDAMARGVVPWRRPWGTIAVSRNAVSDRPYSGINPFLLSLGLYTDPRWVTFKQAQKLGGSVRRGEKGTTIIFWKLFEKKAEGDRDEDERRLVPVLRHYSVFNAEQTEGLDLPPFVPDGSKEFEPIEAADKIALGYQNPPTSTTKEATGRSIEERSIRSPCRQRYLFWTPADFTKRCSTK